MLPALFVIYGMNVFFIMIDFFVFISALTLFVSD